LRAMDPRTLHLPISPLPSARSPSFPSCLLWLSPERHPHSQIIMQMKFLRLSNPPSMYVLCEREKS
jgi:hypothetical protein